MGQVANCKRRTGLDWTGSVSSVLVKRGPVKLGLVKEQLVKCGLVKRGLVKLVLVKRDYFWCNKKNEMDCSTRNDIKIVH